MIRNLVYITLAATFLSSCTTPQPKEKKETPEPKQPMNVILMVGDGMGLSQVSSAFYYGEKNPNFKRFKKIGLSRTTSGSHKITDSAAGATAFSAGIKTYNGAIGVDMDTNAVTTILEELSAKGWNTGLVATSSITHATPASFYAHVPYRKMEEDIASYMVNSEVDFFAGGGRKFFFNRRDSINYYDTLTAKGFIVDTNEIDTTTPLDQSKKYAYLLADNGMPKMTENRGDFLPHATQKALNYLSNGKTPFFLMVEGSQIDWGGHANDAEYLIQEVLDFDKTIGLVLDFAEKQGNTLVVVTADHETGGFTLASEKKKVPFQGKKNDYNSLKPSFSTGGHSTTLVPVFSFGPGSENFMGIFENTDIHTQIKALSIK